MNGRCRPGYSATAALGSLEIAGRRRSIKQRDIVLAMLHAATDDINDAALADLTLQTGKEFLPCWAIIFDVQPVD